MLSDPGRIETYRKIPFEWTAGHTLVDRDPMEGISWIASDGEELIAVVARSLASSLDTSDIAAVRSMGATTAAETLLESAPKWQVSREPDWWRILCYQGEPIGFILPVTFNLTMRAGLAEGTIFHTGVVPDARGRGLGRLLVREAVRILMNAGVRRIFCDTDEMNAPMIHLFESEGWRRLPIREVPLPFGFNPGDTTTIKD